MLWIAIQTTPVQNWLISIATNELSKELGTQVKIKHVSFTLLNSANLEGTFIQDKSKDTLLYAGQLKVRITDWFFFKDKADLKFIGLEDAVIKLTRKDSTWNYQYIVDYFASPTKKEKKKGTIFSLKKIDLKNVYFIQDDKWGGERIEGKVTSLTVDADKIDFDKSIYILNDITIDRPYFSKQNFIGKRPLVIDNKPVVDTNLQLNPTNVFLQLANLSIINGSFISDADTDKPKAYFDAAHLNISKINGTFKNVSLLNDTLKANIDIACKDRSGFELKKLKTAFKVTPQIIELANLDLQTNKSRLGNYFSMSYKHFDKDFAAFVTNVAMNAKFSNSKIYSDDVAFFAPTLASWKKEVDISGNFIGTVDNFTINKLFARTSSTNVNGTLSMKGLPDIDKTKINFNNGTLQTNRSDLNVFVPAIKQLNNPDIAALGNIIFRGSFNGYIKDFVTKGNISTNLGSFYTDIALQFPNNKEPTYKGVLNTTRFNLGKFIGNSKLGSIEFYGKVSGSSFVLDKLKTTIDGNIKQLEFNGYNYTNITTLGTLEKKSFNGQLKIGDKNLDLTGIFQIDFSGEQPRFNLFADILKSNYKELKLTKDNLQLTGTLDVNFVGDNIDNFLGEAKLLNAIIKNDDVEIKFDSLNLVSNYIGESKYLRLSSADFTAIINGEFSILDLPVSFQSFLHKYYPAYVAEPSAISKNQKFSVSLTTNFIEPYLKLIDKKLTGFNDSKITGFIDTKENKFNSVISIPFIQYDKYSFAGVDLKGDGTQDSLTLKGEIASIQLSDSVYLPTTKINIKSANDYSIVHINTKANNTLNDADLVADVYTLEDGARIQFRPSSFVINEKKWNIEKEGELVIRSKFISAKNLKFVQGFQEITVSTETEEDNNASNLNIDLKNVVLGDIMSFITKDPKIEGITSGKIKLNNFFGNFYADATLRAEQFRIDEDSIGIADIKATYDSKSGDVAFNWKSPNEKYKFSATGTYKTKDSTTTTPLKVDIVLDNTRLTLIQKYLSSIFSNLDGYASGVLKINGGSKSINLLGNVKVKDAGMLVNYTQVYYFIDSALIKFEEDGINIGTLNIRDKYNNIGVVRGKLFEQDFKNMIFDFDLYTNKLLLIDTKPKDNQQFYGKAIGKASLSFKGPERDARMKVIAEANDTSHIFIPNSTSRESGDADFIVFKQFGEEMEPESQGKDFNLSVDLDVTTNNKVAIDVILDELAGDVIKANGNGRLRIKAGTNEKLDIRGRYNIENGLYDFNFQSFIRKPFVLLPSAGNFIEWSGDAFRADLHIDAQYEAENISLSDLLNNSSISSNDNALKAQRSSVYVIAQLRGKLNQPSIKFKIDFPQNSIAKTDPSFTQFLSRIEKDDNEMITQAASLIVFGAFTPYGQGLLSGSGGGINYGSIGVNTISQKITVEINKQVSNFLFKLFKDKNLKFDLGSSVYSSSNIFNNGLSASNSNRLDRSRVNFKIGRSFFNNNVIVTFGADLDFGFGSSAAQNGNIQWLPDLNIEVVLSKDKKLRAIVFNKNNLDINGASLGRRNRQGISISYRQEYETLFGKKDDEIIVPPIPKKLDSDNLKSSPKDSTTTGKIDN